MASGKLGLVVVLLVAVTLAEEDLEKDVLTEDEEGVVEEDMSLYTRLPQQTLKHLFLPILGKDVLGMINTSFRRASITQTSFQGRCNHVQSVEKAQAL